MKRDKLIEALMRIREGLCAYEAPHGKLCDCKYGVAEGPRKKGERFPRGSERGSGCPELYEAIGILQSMSDEEFVAYKQSKLADEERVTAGELRDGGVEVDAQIPDCAWVHKSAVQAKAVLVEDDEYEYDESGEGDNSMFQATVDVSFSEPFRWFEVRK
jgi:hypothetical protein